MSFHAAPQTNLKRKGFVPRFRRWWRSADANKRYLAESAHLANLERRMRALERASGGPAFATFNH